MTKSKDQDGCRRWSSDRNSRCSADAEHVQLGLIQTHVSQSQSSEYSRKNDEDRYEASEDDLLCLGEFISFGEGVEAGVGGWGAKSMYCGRDGIGD